MHKFVQNKINNSLDLDELEFRRGKEGLEGEFAALHLDRLALDRREELLKKKQVELQKVASRLAHRRYGITIVLDSKPKTPGQMMKKLNNSKLRGQEITDTIENMVQLCGKTGASGKEIDSVLDGVSTVTRHSHVKKLVAQGVLRKEGTTVDARYFYIK